MKQMKRIIFGRWESDFMLKKSLDLDLKNTRTILLDSDWFYNMLDVALKNIRITLLDLDWFYGILDLDLKYTRTTLLDLDWFY